MSSSRSFTFTVVHNLSRFRRSDPLFRLQPTAAEPSHLGGLNDEGPAETFSAGPSSRVSHYASGSGVDQTPLARKRIRQALPVRVCTATKPFSRSFRPNWIALIGFWRIDSQYWA